MTKVLKITVREAVTALKECPTRLVQDEHWEGEYGEIFYNNKWLKLGCTDYEMEGGQGGGMILCYDEKNRNVIEYLTDECLEWGDGMDGHEYAGAYIDDKDFLIINALTDG